MSTFPSRDFANGQNRYRHYVRSTAARLILITDRSLPRFACIEIVGPARVSIGLGRPTRSIFLKSFRQARHRPAETILLHGNCTALFLHRRRSNSITRNGKLQRGGIDVPRADTDFFTFFIEDPRTSRAFARKRRPLKDALFVRECKRTTRLLSYCGLSDSQCDGPRSSAIPRELYGPLHEREKI